MKNHRECFSVLILLSLLFIFSPGAYTQSAKGPERDLGVSFERVLEGTEFGAVSGTVTNRSINAYPCVRLEFSLYGPDKGTTELGRRLGVLSVEVRDVRPRSVRKYNQPLPYPAYAIVHKSVTECSEQQSGQSVVIYENPDFEGRSRSFEIGSHRLFNEKDFNDVTSSIKVPAGLAVIVYEHADEGGGFGIWVDFLEDQPDLSINNFDKKISYLLVFASQRSGFFYARNKFQNGEFVSGHWERARAGGIPVNPTPVVGPSKPPNNRLTTTNPPPPRVCTITGEIKHDKVTYKTIVGLYRPDRSGVRLFWARVLDGRYSIRNVPEGTYQVIPKGNYPMGSGKSGSLAPFATFTQPVSCRPNGSHRADFQIRSTEG